MEKIVFNHEKSLFESLGMTDTQEGLDAISEKASKITQDFFDRAIAVSAEGEEPVSIKRSELAEAIQNNFSYGEILFFALNHFEEGLKRAAKNHALKTFLDSLGEQPEAGAEQSETQQDPGDEQQA